MDQPWPAMRGGIGTDRLTEALAAVCDGFVVFDADGRLVTCNPAYREIYRPVGERWEPGAHVADIARDVAVHCIGLDDDAVVEAWVRARVGVQRGAGDAIEQRLRDGRWIRVVDFPMAGGWSVGVLTDITDLGRGIREPPESEQMLREILNSLPVAVSVKDIGLRYILANREYESLYGVREEAIRGLTPSDVLGESRSSLARRERHERTVIETGQPLVRDGERTDAQGRRRHVLIEKTPFLDGAGELAGVCSAITDVTRLKEIEDELLRHRHRLEELVEERAGEIRRMHEDLVRSERLAVIGQLTATVAHELRHPLGTIDLSVKAIRKATDEGGPVPVAVLERVERNVRRADHIIGELLAYTRTGELEMRDTALAALVESVVDDLQVPANVELAWELDPVEVTVDESRLSRAIANLVTNALQAMEAGRGARCRLRLACGTRDGLAFITVGDTGPGIPRDLRERVFEPLFSTKSFGTGLGLPLVQRVLELHHGSVEIADAAGGGTQVTLRLPLSHAFT